MRISDWSSDVCSSDLSSVKTSNQATILHPHPEYLLPSRSHRHSAMPHAPAPSGQLSPDHLRCGTPAAWRTVPALHLRYIYILTLLLLLLLLRRSNDNHSFFFAEPATRRLGRGTPVTLTYR